MFKKGMSNNIMQSDEMLNELETNFGLKDNHIKIIKELQLSGELTADKLAKNTGVPLGRIYDFLNDLVESKLVVKTTTFPSIYKIDSLENRVTEFMRYQTESLIKKEQKITSLLKNENETEHTTIVTDRDQLAFETMKTTMESKEIKSIVKTNNSPTILYPLDEQEFIDLRNHFAKQTGDKEALFKGGADKTRISLFRTTKEAYNQNKKFVYLMDEFSIQSYLGLLDCLGKERKKEILHIVTKQLSDYPNVKIYVKKDSTPLTIRVCDKKKVILRFVNLDIPMGVFTQSKKIANFYNSYFDTLLSKAKPIKRYLKLKDQ